MNRVILIGRLTKDPELKYTPSGVPVATFGLAVNRYTKNAQGEREVDFFNLVAWRQRAEFVSQYVAKGRKVVVEGRIQTRNYVAQDGTKRYTFEIQVDSIDTLDSARDPNMAGAGTSGDSSHPADAAPPAHTDSDDFADPFSEG
jgi:single-strand DNA-binding protein